LSKIYCMKVSENVQNSEKDDFGLHVFAKRCGYRYSGKRRPGKLPTTPGPLQTGVLPHPQDHKKAINNSFCYAQLVGGGSKF
jgi:hypothetical protein